VDYNFADLTIVEEELTQRLKTIHNSTQSEGAEHMEQLLSWSTWSTACAVADTDAENRQCGIWEGVPFSSPDF